MISSIVSRLVILLFGTLYPAYASYKAVRTKNVKEYVKWMMYWIVFALFTCAETFTDIFLSFWFPFYYEIKIILVIYLLSPATKGSSILYRKFVHPVLTKREQEIDEYIAKAKEQGYHTVLNLGSKGVNYATTIIMQTAIKGGGGLVNQIRKSYSLGDLSTEKELRKKKKGTEDEVDEAYDEDPRLVRRRRGISPRRSTSSASQVDLYFPEVDVLQRPNRTAEENIIFSHIRSSEDISSGYSSTEPLYSGAKIEGREPLIRTASVGGTTRIRTRASLKTGLPNKKIMTEDESRWTPTEPDESQIETDDFPLLRSLPIPISGNLIAPFVRPEYQYLFGNLTQEQLFTLVNNANFTQIINTNQPGNLNVENKTSRTSPSKFLKEMIREDEKNNQIDEAVVAVEIMESVADEGLGKMPDGNLKILEKVPNDNLKILEKVPDDNLKILEKVPNDNLENMPNDNLKNIEKVPSDNSKNSEKVPNDNLDNMPNDNIKNLKKVPSNNSRNSEMAPIDDLEKTPIDNFKNLEIVPSDHFKNLEKVPNENLENSEKNPERSGKYNKRPAPIPPNSSLLDLRRDSLTFEDAVDFTLEPEIIEIEQEFSTPDSSPILSKKIISTSTSTTASSPTPELETPEKEKPETPASSKKLKKPKNESNISKMLHLSKIHLPFWHQNKSSNKSPVNISKNNSVTSLDAQEGLERFIPLRDEIENKDVPVREMSSSPSSKRKSLTFD